MKIKKLIKVKERKKKFFVKEYLMKISQKQK